MEDGCLLLLTGWRGFCIIHEGCQLFFLPFVFYFIFFMMAQWTWRRTGRHARACLGIISLIQLITESNRYFCSIQNLNKMLTVVFHLFPLPGFRLRIEAIECRTKTCLSTLHVYINPIFLLDIWWFVSTTGHKRRNTYYTITQKELLKERKKAVICCWMHLKCNICFVLLSKKYSSMLYKGH